MPSQRIGILHPGEMGISAAAADVYRRLARFKDARIAPPLDDVLDALRQTEDQSHR